MSIDTKIEREFQKGLNPTKSKINRQQQLQSDRDQRRQKRMTEYESKLNHSLNYNTINHKPSFMVKLLALAAKKKMDKLFNRIFSLELCKGAILSFTQNIDIFIHPDILCNINKVFYALSTDQNSAIYECSMMLANIYKIINDDKKTLHIAQQLKNDIFFIGVYKNNLCIIADECNGKMVKIHFIQYNRIRKANVDTSHIELIFQGQVCGVEATGGYHGSMVMRLQQNSLSGCYVRYISQSTIYWAIKAINTSRRTTWKAIINNDYKGVVNAMNTNQSSKWIASSKFWKLFCNPSDDLIILLIGIYWITWCFLSLYPKEQNKSGVTVSGFVQKIRTYKANGRDLMPVTSKIILFLGPLLNELGLFNVKIIQNNSNNTNNGSYKIQYIEFEKNGDYHKNIKSKISILPMFVLLNTNKPLLWLLENINHNNNFVPIQNLEPIPLNHVFDNPMEIKLEQSAKKKPVKTAPFPPPTPPPLFNVVVTSSMETCNQQNNNNNNNNKNNKNNNNNNNNNDNKDGFSFCDNRSEAKWNVFQILHIVLGAMIFIGIILLIVNGYKMDSVCFTMADRRAHLYGRDVNIAPNGKHTLCLDLRGNMELFTFNNNDNEHNEFELIAKIGNTREMSYGSYPSHSRIYSMKWWDNESIIILFCNNTFLRRKDDEHLKYINNPTNDIDKQQNEIYGFRKYRNISLSMFSSITSLQLFQKYLNDNKYDKALQIANMFKLNTDKAYESQFNFLINQYNQNNNNNNNNNNNSTTNNQQQYDNKIATEWIEILEKINDELWIIDNLLKISICNFYILNRLLFYGINMIQHSEKLCNLRPNGFAKFLKYRERIATLKYIMNEINNFDITQFIDNDNNDNLIYNNYLHFRDANIIQIGYKLAINDSLFALNTIFIYHSHEINKHDRLKILSWIPCTIHPNLYFQILPSIIKPIWNTNRWFAQQFGLSTDDNDNDDVLTRKEIVNWFGNKNDLKNDNINNIIKY